MNTLLTDTLTSFVGPTTSTQYLAQLGLIPLDFNLTQFWGLLPITDTPASVGAALSRTIQCQMTPTIADATGTATFAGGAGAGSSVVSGVAVTDQGGLYAAPPVVTFTGGTPLVTADGRTQNAQAVALCQVRGCIALLGGSGYSGATVCSFVGPLAPGGVPATGTVTVVGNAVTGIVMTNTGGPYLQAPSVVITDSGGGTGAEVVAGLSVSSVTVTYGGAGYQTLPNVVFTPLFKQMIPDSAGNPAQAAALQGWMGKILANALNLQWSEVIAVS